MQIAAGFVEHGFAGTSNGDAIASHRSADGRRVNVAIACTREHLIKIRSTDLHERTELLGEECGERIARHDGQRDVEPATRAECHLRERREQAAIAYVVVSEKPSTSVQSPHEIEDRAK